jgi:hypothetical protein
MGFLRRLLSPQKTPAARVSREVDAWILKPSRRDAVLEVVGEASYQPALEALGGVRTEDGARVREHVALLMPEPNNRYDENAIAVQITGHVVGYLSRENAIAYQPVVRWALGHGRYIACDALLTGGWDRGPGNQGTIGVILHLGAPGECMVELLDDQLAVAPDHEWVGQIIAFTGDSRCIVAGMALDRSSSELIATKAGMIVHPRVTKKVQLLVDCDDQTVSGNQRKALEYGIRVIPEREFWTTLGLTVEMADWRTGR